MGVCLEGKILAGHDVSDGGLITCILEMSFAGISGVDVKIDHKSGSAIEILFAEEVGWVLEVEESDRDYVMKTFEDLNAPIFSIGQSTGLGLDSKVKINNVSSRFPLSSFRQLPDFLFAVFFLFFCDCRSFLFRSSCRSMEIFC